jgi:hypothetical protein
MTDPYFVYSGTTLLSSRQLRRIWSAGLDTVILPDMSPAAEVRGKHSELMDHSCSTT